MCGVFGGFRPENRCLQHRFRSSFFLRVCFLIDFNSSSENAEYFHKRKLSVGPTVMFDGQINKGYPTTYSTSASDSMAESVLQKFTSVYLHTE